MLTNTNVNSYHLPQPAQLHPHHLIDKPRLQMPNRLLPSQQGRLPTNTNAFSKLVNQQQIKSTAVAQNHKASSTPLSQANQVNHSTNSDSVHHIQKNYSNEQENGTYFASEIEGPEFQVAKAVEDYYMGSLLRQAFHSEGFARPDQDPGIQMFGTMLVEQQIQEGLNQTELGDVGKAVYEDMIRQQ